MYVLVKCDLITSFCTIASVSMITILDNTVAFWWAVLTIWREKAFHATVCSAVSLLTGWSNSIIVITIMKQINSVFNKQINEKNKHNVVSLMSSYLPSEKKLICYKNHVKGFKKIIISLPWFASNRCFFTVPIVS